MTGYRPSIIFPCEPWTGAWALTPHFRDWLAHPTYDEYWKPLNLEARAPEMAVPALNIGGWYDVFLRSTLGSYSTMKREAATAGPGGAASGHRSLAPWLECEDRDQRGRFRPGSSLTRRRSSSSSLITG